jgi:hypothetical protein
MRFRFILQPAVALFLAIQAGLKDARSGQAPFLWAVFSDPAHRRDLLREGWKDVCTVFIVALVPGSIYQVIMHSASYTLELPLAATVLALVPYALLRGLVTRLARRRFAVLPTEGQPGN